MKSNKEQLTSEAARDREVGEQPTCSEDGSISIRLVGEMFVVLRNSLFSLQWNMNDLQRAITRIEERLTAVEMKLEDSNDGI